MNYIPFFALSFILRLGLVQFGSLMANTSTITIANAVNRWIFIYSLVQIEPIFFSVVVRSLNCFFRLRCTVFKFQHIICERVRMQWNDHHKSFKHLFEIEFFSRKRSRAHPKVGTTIEVEFIRMNHDRCWECASTHSNIRWWIVRVWHCFPQTQFCLFFLGSM